jgi:hypothetical protein
MRSWKAHWFQRCCNWRDRQQDPRNCTLGRTAAVVPAGDDRRWRPGATPPERLSPEAGDGAILTLDPDAYARFDQRLELCARRDLDALPSDAALARRQSLGHVRSRVNVMLS